MAIVAKYKGDGEFLYGIPGRDLDEDDWALLTKEQQKEVQESSLYQVSAKADKSKGE